MFSLWLAFYLFELALFNSNLWQRRRLWSLVNVSAIIVSSLWLGQGLPLHYMPLFGLLALFRLLNMARIYKARMNPFYLLQATRQTSLALLLVHVVSLWLLFLPLFITGNDMLIMLALLQSWAGAFVFVVTLHNIQKLRFTMPTTYLVDKELPTVTIAVPARNETKDLEQCLKTILANDYPKLEVIVLDDCNPSKTADIIKNFAHDGIRFVQGHEPDERWLAKNHAYEKLAQEASGELILFCGVDVRFGPQAIRSLVNVMYDRKKAMVSILPVRVRGTASTAILQPMRYWWELALPRRLFNRPPVLSTCWMIKRKKLKQLGSFGAVRHSIIPEGFFARELVKTDEYSFIRSSNELDVQTVKAFPEQQQTALRTSYPKIRRRPENALFLMIVDFLLLIGPFMTAIYGLFNNAAIVPASTLACLLLIGAHVAIISVTDPANVGLALFNFPVAVVSELIVGVRSMMKYEFGTITWKDRNICIPVMHVIPRLPKLEEKR